MDFDYDVVVVGGGPAGCSVGVFAARYGLDAVVFDRGPSSLRRCAFLENYLGFPAGVDVDTFYELMREHVAEAGCEPASELVKSVSRTDPGSRNQSGSRKHSGSGFAVETKSGQSVTANRVVAATREGAEYLRPLDGDAMFETHNYDGDEREQFAPDYADADGRTPVDGLYVAAPAGELNAQAIISAGHGARVARSLIADCRRDAELDGEWGDRDRWREWFDRQVPDGYDLGEGHCADDRLAELREADVDRRFAAYLTEAEVEERADRGLERLVETLGPERVLDAMDDERVRAYLPDA